MIHPEILKTLEAAIGSLMFKSFRALGERETAGIDPEVLAMNILKQFFQGLIDIERGEKKLNDITFLIFGRETRAAGVLSLERSLKLLVKFGIFDNFIQAQCSDNSMIFYFEHTNRFKQNFALENPTELRAIKKEIPEIIERKFLEYEHSAEGKTMAQAISAVAKGVYLTAAQRRDSGQSLKFVETVCLEGKMQPQVLIGTKFYECSSDFHPALATICAALGLQASLVQKFQTEELRIDEIEKIFISILEFNYWIKNSFIKGALEPTRLSEICMGLMKVYRSDKQTFIKILEASFIISFMLKSGLSVENIVQEAKNPTECMKFLCCKEKVIKALDPKEVYMPVIQKMRKIFLENGMKAEIIFSDDLIQFYKNYLKSKPNQETIDFLESCYDRAPEMFQFFEKVFSEKRTLAMKKYIPNFHDLSDLYLKNRSLAEILTSDKFLALYGVGIDRNNKVRLTPGPCHLIGCDLKSLEQLWESDKGLFSYLMENATALSEALAIFRVASKRREWTEYIELEVNTKSFGLSVKEEGNLGFQGPDSFLGGIHLNSQGKTRAIRRKIDTKTTFDFSKHVIDFGLILSFGIEGIKLMLERVDLIKRCSVEDEFNIKYYNQGGWFERALAKACPELERLVDKYRNDSTERSEEAEMDSGDEYRNMRIGTKMVNASVSASYGPNQYLTVSDEE